MSRRGVRERGALAFAACVALATALGLTRAGASPLPSGEPILKSPPFAGERPPHTSLLRASVAADPETVWVGHVNGPTGLPGVPGGYGPYHVGRGPNHIIGGSRGTATGYNGVWDFDHFQAGETDSLMGWWPVSHPYDLLGGTDFDDWQRPFWGLDYGNQGNYVLPQGWPKRTFGVSGYWHADGGNAMPAVPANPASHNPLTPTWASISGSKSAWCGLRSHGDMAAVDPVTGAPYNSQVLDFQFNPITPGGLDHNYPGYGSQWDQMLYRDVALPQGSTLTLTFDFATQMSTRFDAFHATQVGWFDKDPLKPVLAMSDGNFISSCVACGSPGVVDSFMVYVGAPVEPLPNVPPLMEPNDFLASDGLRYDVYDPQRRWFSEVVKIDAPGTTYREVLSVAGAQGSTSVPVHFSQTLNASAIDAILDADGVTGDGGMVRIVFRVKTNRGFDDEDYGYSLYTSGTAGAVILDNVVVNGSMIGDFEGPQGGLDTNPATPATAAWKSTGKPPGAYFHVHNLNDELPYTDPCGPIDSPVRFCNMSGNVLSPGDHDLAEKPGGLYGTNSQERIKYTGSPVINLCSSGPGDYNGMGIDSEIANRDLILYGDYMKNLYQLFKTGNTFGFAWQSYPAVQANGVKCWGQIVRPWFTYFVVNQGCFGDILTSATNEHLILTSNPSGVPDSVRVFIQTHTRCYTGTLSSVTCSPTDGVNAGGYFDNLSIGFASKTKPPSFADFPRFNDCFPVNSQNKPVSFFGPVFDTLAAKIQAGVNIAPRGGNEITGPDARENIAADTTTVELAGDNVRVDLVFRILPGVGNYVQIGNRASGVARRPDAVPRVAATPGDAANAALGPVDRFWGAYLADNGALGTGGNGVAGPGHPGGAWDPSRWNSARMDTAETNFFAMEGLQPNLQELYPGSYMSAYHESDPKYSTLGLTKNRCFLNKDRQPVKLNHDQINCGDTQRFGAYPPSFYASVAASGYDPNEIPGQPGKTLEFTKILPDGQFTPGTEIQYFFRGCHIGDPLTALVMGPDTNHVFQNTGRDPVRWYQLAVLPDRWKDPAFGGTGMACMLVHVIGFQNGDQAIWDAVADSIGLTTPAKRGAHNGWRAWPDQDISGEIGGDDTICRRDNGGQAGSMWDLYKNWGGGGSGGLGSRGAARNDMPGSLTRGKWSTQGPSEDMLKNYRLLTILTGPVGVIGPMANQTDDEVGLITSFLTQPGGSPQPRALMVTGSFFATHLSSQHSSFLNNILLAPLRSDSYRGISGNTNHVVDLLVMPPVAPPGGFTYGVFNSCDRKLSVFDTPAPGAQIAAQYENVGAAGPYVGAVYAPTSGTRPFRTLIDGWTFGGSGGFGAKCPGCVGLGGRPILLNVGVRKYMLDLLAHAFGGLACTPGGNPVAVGDQPGSGPGTEFVNLMALRSPNPVRSGSARIVFSLARTERAEVRVYDVTGRLVRVVADRVFSAGEEHVATWDGCRDSGERVAGGVYFCQLRTPTWTSQKKLVVLGL